jgi:hypothetical protein
MLNFVYDQLDKGFRLVYELSYVVEKKFWFILSINGDPYQKTVENIFSSRYENLSSPCRVDKKYAISNFFLQ